MAPSCLKGVLHEGEPAGTTRTIGGVETYVTLPSGEYARDAAVLILGECEQVGRANCVSQAQADALLCAGDIYGQYTNAKVGSAWV